MHLLQDLVDVDLVRLVLGLDALLGAALGDLLGGLLSGSFGSHCGKVLGLGGWGVCRKVGKEMRVVRRAESASALK